MTCITRFASKFRTNNELFFGEQKKGEYIDIRAGIGRGKRLFLYQSAGSANQSVFLFLAGRILRELFEPM